MPACLRNNAYCCARFMTWHTASYLIVSASFVRGAALSVATHADLYSYDAVRVTSFRIVVTNMLSTTCSSAGLLSESAVLTAPCA
jgi:hypothetical protein